MSGQLRDERSNPYESVVREMSDGVFAVDGRGIVRGASVGICTALDRPRSALVGADLCDLLAEDGRVPGADAVGSGSTTLAFEREDGKAATLECWFARDGDGLVCAVRRADEPAAPNADLTDAMSAGADPIDADPPDAMSADADSERLIQAVERASIPLFLADPTGTDRPLVWANEGLEELTGYGAEEAVGRSCRFLWDEDTDPEAVATLREAIDAAEPASVELRAYRKNGEAFWNRVEVAPVRGKDGEVAAVLGHLRDVTARRNRDRERDRRRDERVALNGVVRRINAGLASQSSREGIERFVCESLVEAEPYAAAWIGSADRGDGGIDVRASEGIDDEFVGVVAESGSAAPTARALDRRELQVVSDVAADGDGDWHEAALERGYAAAAAIPVEFQEFQYDVLTIYAARDHAFDGREREAIVELGQIVGHAINAADRREALLTNVVTELEFRMRGVLAPIVEATRERDLRVSVERTVPTRDCTPVQFLRFEGGDADAETAIETVARLSTVEHVRVVGEREEGCTVEVRRSDRPVASTVAEFGGYVSEAVVADGEARLVVELPPETDVRGVADLLEERYPDSELVAQRSATRSVRTLEGLQSAVADRLTEKQRNALEAALAGGYFAWPRDSTGEEIAEALGVSAATFHQHLRLALARILEVVLEAGESAPPPRPAGSDNRGR